MKQNPQSLLSKFFGLHKIINDKKKETYFVVMSNVFSGPLSIHEQYDLKGSTVNRVIELENYDVENMPGIALKDLNFNHKIHLDEDIKAIFLEQLENDTLVTALTISSKVFGE